MVRKIPFFLDANERDLAPGYYFVYARIDDGVNAPQYAYSPIPVHISNPNSPENITDIAVYEGDQSVKLSWKALDDPTVVQYNILYGLEGDHWELTHLIALPPEMNSVTIPSLPNGLPFLFSVIAVNQDNYSSEPVTIVRAVPHSAQGNNHPYIVSKPQTNAVANQPYFYHPVFFDADFHHLVQDSLTDVSYEWQIVQGPEGMTIHESGTLLWTPTEAQIGNHAVTIKLVDHYAQDNGLGIEEAVQEFTVHVASPHVVSGLDEHPHVFITYPASTVHENSLFSYQPSVLADPETVTFELLDGPEGMTILEDGTLYWEVPDNAAGAFVRLLAIINGEYTVEQDFFLHVVTDANTLTDSKASLWENY